MIISHRHKFIFFKPQKTAGTSIELELSKYCGSNDIVTPFIFEPNGSIRSSSGALEPQNFIIRKKIHDWNRTDFYQIFRFFRYPQERFSEHDTPKKLFRKVDDEVKEYYKFSIVRNPYDHAVSYYEWHLYRGHYSGTFLDYTKTYYKGLVPFYFIDDNFILDGVIFFEDIRNGLNQVLNDLGLETTQTQLPNAKQGIRKEKDYKKYYCDESKEMVRQKNQLILEKFNYQF